MEIHFFLSSLPIDGVAARRKVLHKSSGALVVFEGWVRDHHQGRPVEALRYEAFEPLAESEGQRILMEAVEKHGLRAAHCVHRVGLLGIGDTAVWVGAAADHRDSAFAACRYIIDEIKARVPIWKQEFHPGAGAVWSDPGNENVSLEK